MTKPPEIPEFRNCNHYTFDWEFFHSHANHVTSHLRTSSRQYHGCLFHGTNWTNIFYAKYWILFHANRADTWQCDNYNL